MILSKNKISEYSLYATLILLVVLVAYTIIYIPWNAYYKYLLNKNGELVIATIINKNGRWADYDIIYDGIYYRNTIKISKKAFRRMQVGERFYALVLPDKLQYYHEGGITPRCFKIILKPLPQSQQQIEEERERIKQMYGYDYFR